MRTDARDGDSFEQTLRRFTRSVNNSGVLREFRASQRFTSKSEAERVKRTPQRPCASQGGGQGGGTRLKGSLGGRGAAHVLSRRLVGPSGDPTTSWRARQRLADQGVRLIRAALTHPDVSARDQRAGGTRA